MGETTIREKIRNLIEHAWGREVTSAEVTSWIANFSGKFLSAEEEREYCQILATRFLYFSKPMLREMLKALYRDYFESPLKQQIRRDNASTNDIALIHNEYQKKLATTRFIGLGSPAESGAHLLYYFRQVNGLSKNLFVDFLGAFTLDPKSKTFTQRDSDVIKYVFFDDLVGSGSQVQCYLRDHIMNIRNCCPHIKITFMSLFATSDGLNKLNEPSLFNGEATTLFELDNSYKAFEENSRYFNGVCDIDINKMKEMVHGYGSLLSGDPLGYDDSQLLLGFSHNTPDNSLPIFWDEGIHSQSAWKPLFVRFDKNYGKVK